MTLHRIILFRPKLNLTFVPKLGLVVKAWWNYFMELKCVFLLQVLLLLTWYVVVQRKIGGCHPHWFYAFIGGICVLSGSIVDKTSWKLGCHLLPAYFLPQEFWIWKMEKIFAKRKKSDSSIVISDASDFFSFLIFAFFIQIQNSLHLKLECF